MISRLMEFAFVVLYLLIFKVCGIIGISKIEFFSFTGSEKVKMLTEKVRKQKTQILVIKRTQSGESKLIFSDDLKLRKHELNSKGFFNWCSSLTVKFAKFVVFMIISVVALKVFYCNTLWNLKKYECFHRCVKIHHSFHVEAIHYFEW